MRVRDLMTRKLFTLGQSDSLDLADDIMNLERIRHIPVVDSNYHLIGLMTHRDLLKASVSSWANFTHMEQRSAYQLIAIKDVMTTSVITTTPEANLGHAARVMFEDKLGCLPVIDNEKLVGIITEADFLRLICAQTDNYFEAIDPQQIFI